MPWLNKNVIAVLLSTIVLSVVIIAWFYGSAEKAEITKGYPQERVLRFNYELSNTTNELLENVTFSSYIPVAELSNQKGGDITAGVSYTKQEGDLGNRIATFNVGTIPPFGSKIVTFTAKVSTSLSAKPMLIGDKSRFLKSEQFIEKDDPKIIALSQRLKGKNDLVSLENIYRWASQQIQYSGYVSADKGALYAIENKTGDCTEYMYAVVALARALGIPARGVGGYVYKQNKVVAPEDYHNWAEVYIDGVWQIIDAQKKTFMKDRQNYIAMRILSDTSVSLLGSSHRFSSANELLMIKMG